MTPAHAGAQQTSNLAQDHAGDTWIVGDHREHFPRPWLVGVLNVTPDSFFDGGRHASAEAAIARGLEMRDDGAAMIDVGGESTRPGARDVPAAEQLQRVLPVIEALSAAGVRVSVDTRSPRVAHDALAAGAVVVNDVSGGRDPEMAGVVAAAKASYVLMHTQGAPSTMQISPRYDDVVSEVAAWMEQKLGEFVSAGVDAERIAIDVGIGFGKRLEDNLALIREIGSFRRFGRPIMLGASRKSFLAKIGSGEAPADRLGGSIASAVLAWRRGVRIFRVHDVRETKNALIAAAAIEANRIQD